LLSLLIAPASLLANWASEMGGHAVMAVGYNDASQRFLVRNSWGSDWGVGGYFTIPYAYLSDADLADVFWVIRVVK
jgi:C1A family cysteine protease